MSEVGGEAATAGRRRAFAGEARTQRLRGAAQAAFWTAAAFAGRAIVRPTDRDGAPDPSTEPAPAKALGLGWREAFDKDARDVAAGLYVVADAPAVDPRTLLRRLDDLYADGREVEARRQRKGGGIEVRQAETDLASYPVYYRQNFHFQSDGWLTHESARRYEGQVEALFAGAAAPMRRRALSLLAQALRGA